MVHVSSLTGLKLTRCIVLGTRTRRVLQATRSMALVSTSSRPLPLHPHHYHHHHHHHIQTLKLKLKQSHQHLPRRWFAFAASSSEQVFEGKPGLFQIPNLLQPQDFDALTAKVEVTCQELKSKVLTTPPSLLTVQLLDDISNTVCSIIDAAELCRNVHPDEKFRFAATNCVTQLSDFIQELNTDVKLYQALRAVLDDKSVYDSFTEEQKRMTTLLVQEFERDGIHLNDATRKDIIKLQNEITRLSLLFQQQMALSRQFIDIPNKVMERIKLPHSVLHACEKSIIKRQYRVPTDPHVMNTILKWVSDPEIRKKMFMAGNTCASENLEVLDQLQAKRHELALKLGFETYAHLAMSDRMIQDPETVKAFLKDVSHRLMGKARNERSILLATKRHHEGPSQTTIEAWDTAYYMGLVKAQHFQIDSRKLSAFLSLENCLSGLSLICNELFNVQLKTVPMSPEESWHPDVQKVQLMRNGESIGLIYFDLYPRASKYTHAAHFTIRCGKKINDQQYQKPIVALVCNFNKPAPDMPSLLTHAEVETLFHEFGHALHSLLSQTEFQHLSGTRAPLDFVETPSHLFEYFALDERVLHEFARHYETNEPIPMEIMRRLRKAKHFFAAMETQTQCSYSLLDLTLFGKQPLEFEPSTSVQAIKEIQNEFCLVKHVDGTHWHTRFGHLIGYGAGYYSYLYARVFASNIWRHCFWPDPLSGDAGKQLDDEILRFGGARDPMEMMVKLLGNEPTIDSFLTELKIETTNGGHHHK